MMAMWAYLIAILGLTSLARLLRQHRDGYGDPLYLTPNFKLSEFRSKDGADFPVHVKGKLQELALVLEVIREQPEVPGPIYIMSGYRSPAHNALVGGADDSQHLHGAAADIQLGPVATKGDYLAVYRMIDRLQRDGTIPPGGLHLYQPPGGSPFIHLDIRGYLARW